MTDSAYPKINNRSYGKFLRTYLPELPRSELNHLRRHGGDSLVFEYGEDRVLKLGRNDESRKYLRLEFEILSLLYPLSRTVELPHPLKIHEDGLYTTYSKIDGQPLTPEVIASFTPDQCASFANSMGTFLSILHTYTFPDKILDQMEVETDTFDVLLKRGLRDIRNMPKGEGPDAASWERRLHELHAAAKLDLTFTHCDLRCDHVFSSNSSDYDFAIIDFADALIHDRYVDLLRLDLPPDLLRMMLSHYEPDTPQIDDRIEFRNLVIEIRNTRKPG